ncbi:23S rRNA (uracil(1939)-C(5))-methyltransferase RlmD [soil metagenome]
MSGSLARVDVTGIAAGGDGVGRTEGMVVFTPRTAPGDVATVRLARSKRFARGELVSLEVPSPDRVEPHCLHYTADRCGGCQLQHLSYEAQLRAKGTIITDALRRIGRRDVGAVEVEPSDAQWRYRRKLTLHVRRVGTGWIAGLHPYDNPVAAFDLADCPITDERVLAIWGELRRVFDLLPREPALRVAVRLLDTGAAVVVEGGGAWATADRFFAAVSSIAELWWKPDHGRMRRLAARTTESQGGASFVQVNARVAARLHAHVLERVRAYTPRIVVDAYAGAGATALSLAASGSAVVAIELDAEAVARFEGQLRVPSRAIVGRVEEHIGEVLPADVVLLNPPRGGADARVTSALQNLSQPPRAVLYVSCDPATLARDLSRMPRYRLAGVRAYDMFPQTAHVETVCELVPEAT